MWRASLVLLLTVASVAHAERGVLGGSLGLWVKNTAAPELVEVLANHPKFKGQRLRFVTLQGGKPAHASNRLNDAIAQYLMHRILRAGKNDVAWEIDSPRCPAVVPISPHLIGVEIHSAGKFQHRVSIAVIDSVAGVWLSGISQTWSGRLLSAEKQALAAPVSTAAPGSFANPVPVRERQRLLDVIEAQFRCALPRGLDGPVRVRQPAQQDLQMVMREFEQRLALTPTLVLTGAEQDLSWEIQATLVPTSFATQELVVSITPLRDTTAHATPQKVASVFVSGISSPGQDLTSPAVAAAPVQGLLGELVHESTRRGCRAAGACVQISLDLFAKAYLLVFRASDGRVQPMSCGDTSLQRERGTHRYRVQLTRAQDVARTRDVAQTRTGIYVIASTSRTVMQKLRRHVDRAPGACASSATKPHAGWLDKLLTLVDQHAGVLEWRALHLHTPASAMHAAGG